MDQNQEASSKQTGYIDPFEQPITAVTPRLKEGKSAMFVSKAKYYRECVVQVAGSPAVLSTSFRLIATLFSKMRSSSVLETLPAVLLDIFSD